MGEIFGTSAPPTSDVVALFEIGIAVALVAGFFLVRRGRIRLHMYLQSSVIFVNLPVVLLWMVPQYLRQVAPDLPGEFDDPYYLIPTVMLALGIAAQALGIFIVLVAATEVIPERWRFRRYKLWMRTELALWWSVVVVGLTTYYVWYASGVTPEALIGV
jgi:uncharacterized membrane protein YozB (DUF420 family)